MMEVIKNYSRKSYNSFNTEAREELIMTATAWSESYKSKNTPLCFFKYLSEKEDDVKESEK